MVRQSPSLPDQLDLPEYESKAQMGERLHFVLTECSEGFAFA